MINDNGLRSIFQKGYYSFSKYIYTFIHIYIYIYLYNIFFVNYFQVEILIDKDGIFMNND